MSLPESLYDCLIFFSIQQKKVKASCFPRPLTPKNRNINTGSSRSHLHPALSPVSSPCAHTHKNTNSVSLVLLAFNIVGFHSTQADRRQSMMFSIDNTPKKNNYLKKGLNKLRGSTTITPAKDPQSSVGRTGKAGSFKSPQAAIKGRRKSPQASSKSGKSPGLTASARKVNIFEYVK